MKKGPYQKGARSITNLGTKKVTGFFNSIINEIMIPFESLLEMEFAYLLEYQRGIARFLTQPFTTKFKFRGRTRRYTPDFLVGLNSGEEAAVEVKPKLLLDKIDTELLIARKDAVLVEGHPLVYVTDEVIRRQPRLGNIKMLYPYGFQKITPRLVDDAISFIRYAGTPSLGDVAQALNSRGITLNDIYYLIFHRHIDIDINQPLTRSTKLFIKNPDKREDLTLWQL